MKRNHRRVHSNDNPVFFSSICHQLCDCQQFDDKPHFTSSLNVGLGHLPYALAVHISQGDSRVERQFSKNGGFGRCINTVNIERGICLQITQCICLIKNLVVIGAFFVHFGQHEVGRPVYNAHYLGDSIPCQGLSQWADKRNSPGNGCLEI